MLTYLANNPLNCLCVMSVLLVVLLIIGLFTADEIWLRRYAR